MFNGFKVKFILPYFCIALMAFIHVSITFNKLSFINEWVYNFVILPYGVPINGNPQSLVHDFIGSCLPIPSQKKI